MILQVKELILMATMTDRQASYKSRDYCLL